MELLLLLLPLALFGISTSDEDDEPSDENRTGTDAGELIETGAGDDTISAGAGDDGVLSGDGDDLIFLGAGDDQVAAGAGNDTVWGGTGDDLVTGGPGNDRIFLQDGDDEYAPFENSLGLSEADMVSGDDLIRGGAGNDVIIDTIGSDTVWGDLGNDVILTHDAPGTDAADELHGGFGSDLLFGDDGDVMTGGAGADIFATEQLDSSVGEDPVMVTDFAPGEDGLLFDVFTGPPVPTVALQLAENGLDTEVLINDQTMMVLANIMPTQVDMADIQARRF